MRLNKGDTIRYNDTVYTVGAVVMSTVYLCPAADPGKYDYSWDEVKEYYRDFEFMGKR